MSELAHPTVAVEGGAVAGADTATTTFVVDLDGYEGPLDVLLALAREQKVDLRQISILALADQYLAFIAGACRARLEIAAEYLVMAAWLAYLKSRLLLPAPPSGDEPSADALAAALARRLVRLEALRAAAARLFARPQLGRDFFARGHREPTPVAETPAVRAELGDLLAAYATVLRRRQAAEPMLLEPLEPMMTVEDALARIRRGLGSAPGWESLVRYLPEDTLAGLRSGRLAARVQLAATLIASLELAREGTLLLRQSRPFGPIYIRAAGALEP